MKKIIYATGNKFKLEMANSILNPLGIEVEGRKIEDLPEIQADKIEDVAIYSSQYAAKELGMDVLKNDSGLVIPALHGFPSAYTKYVEETITEDGILKLMEGLKNREAYFVEVLAYTTKELETEIFVSKTYGKIATEKRGEYGWSYDRIFIPEGKDVTLAELPDEERYQIWDNTAYEELSNYLKEENKKS